MFSEQTRFLATIFLVLACLTLNWANILTFNFTVICMTARDDTTTKVNDSNDALGNASLTTASSAELSVMSELSLMSGEEEKRTKRAIELILMEDSPVDNIPTYELTSTQRSWAMSIVAVGALLANFPVVVFINWHGPRVPFTLLGLIGAFATAAVPWCLDLGFYWFLGARFLQGVAFAGDMATFGHFLANWTEHKRYAFLTATLALYVQLAPFFTFPAAGVLCNSSFGWPGVYYAHAMVTVFFFILFGMFYKNRAFMPATAKAAVNSSNSSSEAELENAAELLEASAASLNLENARERKKLEKLAKKHIPYREILTSKATWAIFLSAVGDFTAVNLLYQFTPTYLYAVQGFKVMETGLMATLPPLVQAIMKELAGLLNDRIPRSRLSETAKTKLFNSVALFSTVGFLLCLAAVPSGNGFLALGLITAAEALLGFIVGGFYKCGPQLAGLYGPFVMGQVSTALTLTMLVVPYLVSLLTYDNTFMEWAIAFCSVAAVAILCNIYYLLFARAEPEPWATLDHFRARQVNNTMAALAKKLDKEKCKNGKQSANGQQPMKSVTTRNGRPAEEME